MKKEYFLTFNIIKYINKANIEGNNIMSTILFLMSFY